MGQVEFSITDDVPRGTTDREIAKVQNGGNSAFMSELYFHYSRYLMISSSVCGKLPANLQGKWNEEICPAWKSDYHFDTNLQMNYWMAEPCGLSACTEALFRYIEKFYEKAALDLYSCRGILLSIQTDAWTRATPELFVWIGATLQIAQYFLDALPLHGRSPISKGKSVSTFCKSSRIL